MTSDTVQDEPRDAVPDTALHRRLLAWRVVWPAIVVFVVAAVSRLAVIFRSGGLHGSFGYDAAVYFGASDALSHGRMPYRDFVFLHPPGMILSLSPFAWLTRLVSDEWAFTIANLSFAILGSVNAVLVLVIGKKLGFGRTPALVGALFYATWFGAIGSEYLTKLEPVGNFYFLCALLAVATARHRNSRWLIIGVGVALGLAVSVKIWWVVPAVGVMVWYAVTHRRARSGAAMLAGACGSAVLVNLPFFLLAPHQMWSSVISDQLGRNRGNSDPLLRIGDLTTLPRLSGYLSRSGQVAGAIVVVIVFVAVMVRAWRVKIARPVVVLVGAQLALVLAAPSWFAYYCDYLAVGLALTVAAAATRRDAAHRLPRATAMAWLPTAAVASISAVVLLLGASAVHPFRGTGRLIHGVAGASCVMSDEPMGQIELNALSRGLAHGCENWIDVTGRTYGPDRPRTAGLSRAENRRWQADLTRYLRSGDAILILRRGGTGISKATQRAISSDGVLVRAGHHVVYRVQH